jgi:cell wall-associated NlpC family hydrolase
MITRRHFAASVLAAGVLTTRPSVGQAVEANPAPKSLSSGDLLWPKKPGVYVPYDTSSLRSPEEDRRAWEEQKETFLADVSRKAPYLSAEDQASLRQLTFERFYAAYAGARPPGQLVEYGASTPIYVGHVAIVLTDTGADPWIVEAIWGKGVVRSRYSEWLASRRGELIWQGRIKDRAESDRAKIATEAARYLGRPYDFWNFDLDDDAGFYCSKLIWLATHRALGFSIDDNPASKRGFWFSPKQLLYTPRVQIVLDQGPYANR